MKINGVEELKMAIIKKAINDYRHPPGITKRQQQGQRNTIVKFFRSEWYKTLCDIDGEIIIKKLKQEQGQPEYIECKCELCSETFKLPYCGRIELIQTLRENGWGVKKLKGEPYIYKCPKHNYRKKREEK